MGGGARAGKEGRLLAFDKTTASEISFGGARKNRDLALPMPYFAQYFFPLVHQAMNLGTSFQKLICVSVLT